MELEIRKLSKRYGAKTAVDGVSLTITPGVWGLIGANGAGKTTLMRMLVGILTPTAGSVLYNGTKTSRLGERYRSALGYLPQTFGFHSGFTVTDYLEYAATLKGLSKSEYRAKIDELLEVLTLTDCRKKRIKKLSGGMQRRVGIAQAMLNDPEILILDEPTSGLDPGERVRFRNLLSEFAQNRIVLVSTHIVSDVEHIAVRNAIIKDGKIIGAGTSAELLTDISGKVFTANIPQDKLAYYEKQTCIINIKGEDGGSISVRYVSDTQDIPGSHSAEPHLEDLYLWLFRKETVRKGEFHA